MSEVILYRPYQSNRITALIPFFVGVLSSAISIILSWFVLLLLSILMFLLAIEQYLEYSEVIAFGDNEIQVFENVVKKRYVWTDFSNAYLGRNFKAFQYLILSNKALDEKQVRKLCNKRSMTKKCAYGNDVFVIIINDNYKGDIEKLVKSKFNNITQYM